MPKLKLIPIQEPKGKPWYKSKTVWLNIATILAAMGAGAEQLLPTLSVVLSAGTVTWLLFAIGIINLALRFVTTEGISVSSRTEG